MATFELSRFPNAATLARTAADLWLDEVASANKRGAAHHVALSGGRIARDFFQAVTKRARARGVALSRVHFFWADERCVSPTDTESNYAVARELLFTPLGVEPEHIHRIRGEDEPATAAVLAARELRGAVAARAQDLPMLDLILLGMGEDGHVASLFPGEPEAQARSEAVYRPVVASKPPPNRITLGYGAIADARNVWVLASGAGKENALSESLAGGRTPLGRVVALRASTRILTDIREAA